MTLYILFLFFKFEEVLTEFQILLFFFFCDYTFLELNARLTQLNFQFNDSNSNVRINFLLSNSIIATVKGEFPIVTHQSHNNANQFSNIAI